ncbi:hypothetical protein ACNJFE_21145, partial [Mycobacterium tuberculosis]
QDENSTHYFWNMPRNRNIDSEEVSEKLRKGIGGTFANEDGRMVALCAEMMNGETDLLKLKPLLLPSDEAAVRARRTIARLLAEEAAEAAAEA